jgi:hypothetical protein
MPTIELQVSEFAYPLQECLKGSIDFHVHSHAEKGYRQNLDELASQALAAGMSGLVIKNLYGTSQEDCHRTNRRLGRVFLYPSLTLGQATGGLNSSLVENFSNSHSANCIVEMPVFDSVHEIRLRGLPLEQAVPLFRNNHPVPELVEILKTIAQRDMVLKTGHGAPEESLELIRLAKDHGVKKIIVTHATGSPVMATPKEQREMADLGAYVEHCLCKFLPISCLKNIKRFPRWKGPDFGDLDYLKASLESVGPDRCIVATDSGQLYNPLPMELFIYFLYLLEEMECSTHEIKIMCRDNPRRILKISDD